MQKQTTKPRTCNIINFPTWSYYCTTNKRKIQWQASRHWSRNEHKPWL